MKGRWYWLSGNRASKRVVQYNFSYSIYLLFHILVNLLFNVSFYLSIYCHTCASTLQPTGLHYTPKNLFSLRWSQFGYRDHRQVTARWNIIIDKCWHIFIYIWQNLSFSVDCHRVCRHNRGHLLFVSFIFLLLWQNICMKNCDSTINNMPNLICFQITLSNRIYITYGIQLDWFIINQQMNLQSTLNNHLDFKGLLNSFLKNSVRN